MGREIFKPSEPHQVRPFAVRPDRLELYNQIAAGFRAAGHKLQIEELHPKNDKFGFIDKFRKTRNYIAYQVEGRQETIDRFRACINDLERYRSEMSELTSHATHGIETTANAALVGWHVLKMISGIRKGHFPSSFSGDDFM